MSARWMTIAVVAALGFAPVKADELLYRHECDVLPDDESAGWRTVHPCEDECNEFVEDGHLVLHWPEVGHHIGHGYVIGAPPPTLWVEWRFRSNQPKPSYSHSCDAGFSVNYKDVSEVVNLFGDAATSHLGDYSVHGLDIDEFHTYRFESLDGSHSSVSANGTVFITGFDAGGYDLRTLSFRGEAGCYPDGFPVYNEWDFVRFGTIETGEQIVSSNPRSGFLLASQYGDLKSFTVTFDAPNYVYVEDITVEVSGGLAPTVVQARRRENDGPETVEIVLDRPMPANETTRFIFNDGEATGVVEYTLSDAVPASSAWSLIVLTLAGLTVGTVLFRNRRVALQSASP